MHLTVLVFLAGNRPLVRSRVVETTSVSARICPFCFVLFFFRFFFLLLFFFLIIKMSSFPIKNLSHLLFCFLHLVAGQAVLQPDFPPKLDSAVNLRMVVV